jgi:hypothetical protein
LHHDPSRAEALAGFCVVAIAVDAYETLSVNAGPIGQRAPVENDSAVAAG